MLKFPSTVPTRSASPASPLDEEPTRFILAPPWPSSRTTSRNQGPCCAELSEARDASPC